MPIDIGTIIFWVLWLLFVLGVSYSLAYWSRDKQKTKHKTIVIKKDLKPYLKEDQEPSEAEYE